MSAKRLPTRNLQLEWERWEYAPPCPVLVWWSRFLLGLAVGLSAADELLGDVPLGWAAAAAVVLAAVLAYRAHWCKE